MSVYYYSFNAVRGIQAGRPCYIAMCPMSIIPKIFVFNEDEVPPEIRAQSDGCQNQLKNLDKLLVPERKDKVLKFTKEGRIPPVAEIIGGVLKIPQEGKRV